MVESSARKKAARDLASRTGVTYAAAARLLQEAHVGAGRPGRLRWVLTDEVRDFFAGTGWRGLVFEDLYGWLDGLRPIFDCEWCDEPGDAREQDCSIRLVVATYDPDLSPETAILTSSKYHAACQASSIAWAHQIDIPSGPFRITLPASADPQVSGGFAFTASAFLPTGPGEFDDPDEWQERAVLVLQVEVFDDAGEGTVPWLNELQLWLAGGGFASPEGLSDDGPSQWSVRIAENYAGGDLGDWVAVRSEPIQVGTRARHLFLGRLNLPPGWAQQARDLGEVLLVVGPLPLGLDVPAWPDPLDFDGLEDVVMDLPSSIMWGPVRVDSTTT